MRTYGIFSFLTINLLATFYSTPSFAVLPPYYESSKEITAILNDPTVADKITSGRPINSITRTETGYTIVARECSLEVKINYLPQKGGMVGPAKFEMKPGDLKCNVMENSDLELLKD